MTVHTQQTILMAMVYFSINITFIVVGWSDIKPKTKLKIIVEVLGTALLGIFQVFYFMICSSIKQTEE